MSDQNVNAQAVLVAVQGAIAGNPNKLAFMTDVKTAMTAGSVDDCGVNWPVKTYGATFSTVKAALPQKECLTAADWELSIGGIAKQIAYFCVDANNTEDAITNSGNTVAVNHFDLIKTYVDARVVALTP